ncbi:hypothetical protein FRC02_007410 [Tulasnella sp. 418]|nr:hypothetical protein FRC02_007410 [Tulasnella sp. 418]
MTQGMSSYTASSNEQSVLIKRRDTHANKMAPIPTIDPTSALDMTLCSPESTSPLSEWSTEATAIDWIAGMFPEPRTAGTLQPEKAEIGDIIPSGLLSW